LLLHNSSKFKMITHLSLKALITCLQLFDKIQHGPLSYNQETNSFQIVKNKWRIWYWYFQNICFVGYLIIMTIFILVQLFSMIPPYGIFLTVITLDVMFCLLIIIVVNIPLLIDSTNLVNLLNNIIQTDRKFKSKT